MFLKCFLNIKFSGLKLKSSCKNKHTELFVLMSTGFQKDKGILTLAIVCFEIYLLIILVCK